MYIGEGVPYEHGIWVPPSHRFGVFCLFSVLWYTFRGSKKVFAMAYYGGLKGPPSPRDLRQVYTPKIFVTGALRR